MTETDPRPGRDEEQFAGEVVEVDSVPSPEDERVAQLLIHSIDVPILAEAVAAQEAADAADTLEHLEDEEAADVLVAMDDEIAAEALAEMEDQLAAVVIDDLVDEGKASYAARLLQLMAPDDAADLLQALDDEYRYAVFQAMPPTVAVRLRQLVGYDQDTAGGLMTTDYVALDLSHTVDTATDVIRASELPDDVQSLPVIDPAGRLVGIVSLRDLLLRSGGTLIDAITVRDVKAIRESLDQEAVAREFDRYDLVMLPVVDEDGLLLGVVTVDDVIDIIRDEQTEDVQKTVGAGAEEAVYSSVLDKFRGRFPWLVVSSIIMVPSAWVVLRFEDLIAELAILAMLMPVVAALAGNAGHQALAVTLRGIVLEEVRPDRVGPLVRRELFVGLLTGLTLGALVGLAVSLLGLFVESASWRLGLVAGVSMTCSMGAGTLAGSAIPLAMRRFGADPAQSSAIFLIMITDAAAFATFLGLARLTYGWLVAGEPML